MTVQQENPQITRARSWEEWLAERSQIDQYVQSDAVIKANRKKLQAAWRREQRNRAKVWMVLEQEEEYQTAHAEEIAAENRAAAEKAAEEACKTCFCIHPGEC
jgi:hypothetical protein